MVLDTLIQGAVESNDAIAQKVCFNVLSKLVQGWGKSYIDYGPFPRMSTVKQLKRNLCNTNS